MHELLEPGTCASLSSLTCAFLFVVVLNSLRPVEHTRRQSTLTISLDVGRLLPEDPREVAPDDSQLKLRFAPALQGIREIESPHAARARWNRREKRYPCGRVNACVNPERNVARPQLREIHEWRNADRRELLDVTDENPILEPEHRSSSPREV